MIEGCAVQTGRCGCGIKIFFYNTECIACHAVLGHCENCQRVSSFGSSLDASHGANGCCANCNEMTRSCTNRSLGICNSQMLANADGALCEFCAFTEMLPSLDLQDNVAKLQELERAKRQLLLQLQLLGLPPERTLTDQFKPLRFRFLADTIDESGGIQRVYTGHADGIITLNIQEADSVYRERTRIELNEPQRTLIGHLRHEYGHYLDWCLPEERRSQYIDLFGDPAALAYEDAKQKYYSGDRVPNWKDSYVSEYASMHPWEDFAESTNLYLDLLAVISTAQLSPLAGRLMASVHEKEIGEIVRKALDIAIFASELNADLGLAPLLPENIPSAVVSKLAFIHGLRHWKPKRWGSLPERSATNAV